MCINLHHSFVKPKFLELPYFFNENYTYEFDLKYFMWKKNIVIRDRLFSKQWNGFL